MEASYLYRQVTEKLGFSEDQAEAFEAFFITFFYQYMTSYTALVLSEAEVFWIDKVSKERQFDIVQKMELINKTVEKKTGKTGETLYVEFVDGLIETVQSGKEKLARIVKLAAEKGDELETNIDEEFEALLQRYMDAKIKDQESHFTQVTP